MTSIAVTALNSCLASCSCKTQFPEGSKAASSELRVESTRLEIGRGLSAWSERHGLALPLEEECYQVSILLLLWSD